MCPKMALKDEDSSITMGGTRVVTGPAETVVLSPLKIGTHTLHVVILPQILCGSVSIPSLKMMIGVSQISRVAFINFVLFVPTLLPFTLIVVSGI